MLLYNTLAVFTFKSLKRYKINITLYIDDTTNTHNETIQIKYTNVNTINRWGAQHTGKDKNSKQIYNKMNNKH